MTTIEISSVGQLASQLRRHVSEVRDACSELAIVPAYRINNVEHFSAQDCRRVAEYFRRQREESTC